MANASWERIKMKLTCAACKKLLKDPKVLPCLHSYCTGCLKERTSGSTIVNPQELLVKCEACKTKVSLSGSSSVEELLCHFSAIRLVEIVRMQEQASSTETTLICQSCNSKGKAVSFCRECAAFLCEDCEKAHKMLKVIKEHKTCSLDEVKKGTIEVLAKFLEKDEMCPTHLTKPLDLYCRTDKELICRDCIVRKHKDHIYDVTLDFVKGEKENLRVALEKVKSEVDEVETAITKIKDMKKDVENRKDNDLTKLDNTFNGLRAALDVRQQQLREKITAGSERKGRDLQEQEDELCDMLDQLKDCHSFIEDKVEQGVSRDLLAMGQLILKRMNELIETKKKIRLQPVVVRRNQLQSDFKQLDEMVRLISQMR